MPERTPLQKKWLQRSSLSSLNRSRNTHLAVPAYHSVHRPPPSVPAAAAPPWGLCRRRLPLSRPWTEVRASPPRLCPAGGCRSLRRLGWGPRRSPSARHPPLRTSHSWPASLPSLLRIWRQRRLLLMLPACAPRRCGTRNAPARIQLRKLTPTLCVSQVRGASPSLRRAAVQIPQAARLRLQSPPPPAVVAVPPGASRRAGAPPSTTRRGVVRLAPPSLAAPVPPSLPAQERPNAIPWLRAFGGPAWRGRALWRGQRARRNCLAPQQPARRLLHPVRRGCLLAPPLHPLCQRPQGLLAPPAVPLLRSALQGGTGWAVPRVSP